MNIQDLAVYCGVALITIIIAALYGIYRRRRWSGIIEEALAYHKYHFKMIQNEPGGNTETKDILKTMQMVLDKQFMTEKKRNPGGGGLWLLWMGGKSTLNSLDEIFVKLYRDRYFGHASNIDARAEKLHSTLTSTIYRFYLIHSLLALPALIYMDIVLVLSIAGFARQGSSRLFRDIALSPRSEKI